MTITHRLSLDKIEPHRHGFRVSKPIIEAKLSCDLRRQNIFGNVLTCYRCASSLERNGRGGLCDRISPLPPGASRTKKEANPDPYAMTVTSSPLSGVVSPLGAPRTICPSRLCLPGTWRNATWLSCARRSSECRDIPKAVRLSVL